MRYQFQEFHSKPMKVRVPAQRAPLVGRLVTLWEASVRATHHFLADGEVEMLFVAPAHFNKGVGKRLLDWAVDTQHCRFVDVNEQNGRAVAIYEHWGFRVCGRTETDAQGNSYPILRMRLEA